MKRLIFYVIVLIAAVWLGLTLNQHPGYVLVAYNKWTLETSLWFGIALVIVAFLIVYYFFKVLSFFLTSRGHIFRWYRTRRQVNAHTATGAGLLALDEADWGLAEDLLAHNARVSRLGVVNYLGAAKAAQAQAHYKQRDRYLVKAKKMAETIEERIAVGLVKAQLQYKHEQYDDALVTLEKLGRYKANHPQRLKLLCLVYKAQKKWNLLSDLLPQAKKRKAFDEKQFDEIKLEVMMQLVAKVDQSNVLLSMFKNERKFILMYAGLLESMCRVAHRFHDDAIVSELIIAAMKNDYDATLTRLFGELQLDSPQKQLKQFEQWRKQYGDRPVLLNGMSRVLLQLKENKKAKTLSAESLKLEETADGYAILARAQECLGDQQAAAQAYKKGLLLV